MTSSRTKSRFQDCTRANPPMDLIFLVVVLLVVASLGVLAAVFWLGANRRDRLALFAEARGGEVSDYDEFDLQPAVDAIFEEPRFVGLSARLPRDDAPPVYLLDLHAEADGPPLMTAVLTESPRPADDAPESVPVEAPDDVEWHPELHRTDRWLLVAASGRVLLDPDDWSTLLTLADGRL